MFSLKYHFLILLPLLQLIACESDNNNQENKRSTPYSYQQPINNNDGWQTASLNELNIDSAPLVSLMKNINNNENGYRYIDSILIAKNNRLIFYEQIREQLDFTDNWGNNKNVNLHILNSVTKSFTSALIGIAIDQGFIPNTEVKVFDYFQHKSLNNNWDNRKNEVTLKNWLTMRHGFLWDEWNVSYLDSNNLNSQMNNNNDPIQFLLDRPMGTNPGESFAYSTGISFGIGRILQLATGLSVTEFMQQNLFAPLNITNFDTWSLDDQLHTGSGLYLNTRDMAKFGQLFLDKGKWQGQQVISEAWVNESTTQIIDKGNWGYGYQWWMTSYDVNGEKLETFYADGFGGQYIFIFPKINVVIAITGSAYEPEQRSQRNLTQVLEQHILPVLVN
ncbi:serine hydrolase domain-containing protein [Pseudoalteromonas denitrificans]|uniref:CubicO group peptidase, beta-lactamase class C family n=1 Tax=Pseudoalteromonas denitrificans DSM 6059 TaxID=1123010 RepID=A0A1I1PZH6_9GAMM|nr:serine hydrolase [Pseudoalteromonas denitrificans]SFD15062.1 CubicO group peptidase, beta-lactamase class C family [Pseudoalteromonas denitrificans DSM 6059]